MSRQHATRSLAQSAVRRAAAGALLCLLSAPAWAYTARPPQDPAPIERRPPSAQPVVPSGQEQFRSYGQTNPPPRRGPRGEHLAEWMNQHSSLTPQQQQQALQHEPGFEQLPATTQQRMRERLAQLDAMSPQQRQRVLARTEAMERLNPDQRAQVRSAMSQLGALPQGERHQVAQTFRSLRDLPPEQRVQAYASGRYGPPLNENQRAVLMNLLRVEPMLPPPAPAVSAQPMSTPPMGQTLR